MSAPWRIVVLISGNGSNLQAFIDRARDDYPARIVGVLSNRADAFGIERARAAGIPVAVIDHKAFTDRAAFDAAMMRAIDAWRPDVVVLAGFMRILTPGFVKHYAGRLLNIHPSLLPKFPGTDTHRRAIAAGEREHGCSVHFVTEELDGGPVVAQERVPVHPDDTPETLRMRVHAAEHRLYPEVVARLARGEITVPSTLSPT